MGRALALLGIFILCALGSWQLKRLEWKEGVLADIAAASALPPLSLDIGEKPANFRHVLVQGTYDRAHDLTFPAKVKNGEVGVWVATPLMSNGHTYIVNRGWMKKPEPAPAGEVTLIATARYPEPPHWFQPENNVSRNEWYRLDLKQISEVTEHPDLAPFYIVVGDDAVPEIPNNHLQYALTWFTLAGILLLFTYRKWNG